MSNWSAELTRHIASRIKALRGDRSAQWLSDRTAELGHRVSRSTISEIETGKRQTIAIDALLVLSWALQVSPMEFLGFTEGGSNGAITDEMRQAADILEKVSRLYDWKDPARGEWSARQLRYEADYLDRPVAM
jgi:DNA-binding Xre family transcriptional regulator